ncbi:hypothetical protein HB364_10435 [Pseudoflavitalea sp. X16]|uniref:hypothetical protein n=1 Tax=Paraflavitalea devenefica TaxID=2716334 RepID=UPI001423C3A0|nr:hypothetical protein [Paraflavitalea devenefica]NII25501.1 hypothetical protein [Paraflavitalea devenefica]
MLSIRIAIGVLINTTLLSLHCGDSEKGDLYDDKKVSGTLFINDTLRSMDGEKVYAKGSIRITDSNSPNSLNFLYSSTADNYGNFSFTNLTGLDYRLQSSLDSGDITFAVDEPINPAKVTTPQKLVLYPVANKYNVLSVQAFDDATKGALFQATVCLFSSRLLAQKNQCEGSFKTLTTDSHGRAYTTRLAPGWYYLNATLKTGQIDISIKDSIEIKKETGFNHIKLYLK